MISLKVSKTTQFNLLAGSIANNIRSGEHDTIEVCCIGNEAIRIAVRACILANKFLVEDNLSFSAIFDYFIVENQKNSSGRDLVGIKFVLTKQNGAAKLTPLPAFNKQEQSAE